MKYTAGLIMAVAAIGSSAQSFADLPECGVCLHLPTIYRSILLTECTLQKNCVKSMLDKAGVEFGCKADDAGCLCANVDFTYGIRDCSLETCEHEAEGVINYGAEYCRSKSRLILAPSPTLVHPLTMSTDEGGVVITTASADPSAVSEISVIRFSSPEGKQNRS